tara:strand:+ start:292 stop:597 length:306 start_codon:yes stop_codon:yes gene_type:complete
MTLEELEHYEEIKEAYENEYYFTLDLKKGTIEIFAHWHSDGGLEYDICINKYEYQEGGFYDDGEHLPNDFHNPDTDYLFNYLVADILKSEEIQNFNKSEVK